VIGRLEKTVIDCPDPRALAEFYCQVLGMRINEDIDGWVVIGAEPGRRELAFQRATEWIPPRWPDPAHPQQLHLDIRVNDATWHLSAGTGLFGTVGRIDQPCCCASTCARNLHGGRLPLHAQRQRGVLHATAD